jgi:carbamoyltransferase
MGEAILGISSYYHDSAATIIVGGKILAAAHEERFTRIKHDSNFPTNACKYCLQEAGLEFSDLAGIAFYDKPYLKFERLLETYHAFAPKGIKSFYSAMPVWIKEKLFMKKLLKEEFVKLGRGNIPVFFPEHHLSHAASAFYPSPFEEAAILTIDGVGEWATTTICKGQSNSIKIIKELHFPHSLGLLYSAFTYYTGFKVNSGEYKLMGLAPYGNDRGDRFVKYKDIIKNKLIDIREDGSFLLNMDYFHFATGLRMTHDKKWQELFGIPPRTPESEISQEYMDLALAIQRITEEIVLKLAETAKELTQCSNLVMAGGVALNSVANGKLLKENIFDKIWIQPAAGDAGGSLGAALCLWYIYYQNQRKIEEDSDSMCGGYLGPEYNDKEILRTINKYSAHAKYYEDFTLLSGDVAKLLAEGKIIGWFQGRMEFGPRALGNRSILADARKPEMQKKVNLRIKFREGFRPFAPSVLEADSPEYFELETVSPYMLLVVPLNESRRNIQPDDYPNWSLYDKLYFLRSDLPAITHIDYSARIHTVSKKSNPKFWELINNFKKETGYGLILNTSFNVRGEPIVCTPVDALQCFMSTEMDYLVMGNFVLEKGQNEGLKRNIQNFNKSQLD